MPEKKTIERAERSHAARKAARTRAAHKAGN